jgi:hypothetical protein
VTLALGAMVKYVDYVVYGQRGCTTAELWSFDSCMKLRLKADVRRQIVISRDASQFSDA